MRRVVLFMDPPAGGARVGPGHGPAVVIRPAGPIPAKSERSYAHEFGRNLLVSITMRARGARRAVGRTRARARAHASRRAYTRMTRQPRRRIASTAGSAARLSVISTSTSDRRQTGASVTRPILVASASTTRLRARRNRAAFTRAPTGS